MATTVTKANMPKTAWDMLYEVITDASNGITDTRGTPRLTTTWTDGKFPDSSVVLYPQCVIGSAIIGPYNPNQTRGASTYESTISFDISLFTKGLEALDTLTA